MESPRTYYGYNDEGKCVARCTATDANTFIDPAEVKAALDNLQNVFSEEMSRISTSIRDVSSDAKEAVIVQGTNMSSTVEKTADAIAVIPSEISGSLDGLYASAVSAHDALQQQCNEEAKAAVSRSSGVVRVSG